LCTSLLSLTRKGKVKANKMMIREKYTKRKYGPRKRKRSTREK